jgi:hypothetical protein
LSQHIRIMRPNSLYILTDSFLFHNLFHDFKSRLYLSIMNSCFNIPFILSATAFSYGQSFHTWQYSVFKVFCNHSHNIATLCLNDESMFPTLSLFYSHIKSLNTAFCIHVVSNIISHNFLRIGICNNAQHGFSRFPIYVMSETQT